MSPPQQRRLERLMIFHGAGAHRSPLVGVERPPIGRRPGKIRR
ncbi:hypothetical protein ABZ744_26300 [Micromonospora chersina]